MQKNFSMRGIAELVVGGKPIDLHNLYRATSISTDVAGSAITLVFQRDHEWQGPEDLPERVTLTCSGNVKLAFNDLALLTAPLSNCAVEVAYFDGDCGWDEFLDEGLATRQGLEGLHFNFEGPDFSLDDNFVLRIMCDIAEAATS
jgi:hypothetical protein